MAKVKRSTKRSSRRPGLMMKKAGVTRSSRPYKCGGKLKKK